MFSVLVVEDDLNLNRLFRTVLTKDGYQTVGAEDGSSALRFLEAEHFDLIICDVMMPTMDGIELTGAIRAAGFETPILMITARGSFEDKQKAFRAGIDDYMVKPIEVGEMVLRVEALLRRAKIVAGKRIEVGTAELDYQSLTIRWPDGTEVILPQKEFNLLFKLLSFPGRIFTRQQLMDEIWGYDSDTDERTVDVHVSRLRDRFRSVTDFEIVTIRGLGYKAVRGS